MNRTNENSAVEKRRIIDIEANADGYGIITMAKDGDAKNYVSNYA